MSEILQEDTEKKSTTRYWILAFVILLIIFKIVTLKGGEHIIEDNEKAFLKNIKHFENVVQMYTENYEQNYLGYPLYSYYIDKHIIGSNINNYAEINNFSVETLNNNKESIQKTIENYPCEKNVENIVVYENGIVAFKNIGGVELIAYVPKGEKNRKKLKKLIKKDADGVHIDKIADEWYYISAEYYLFF
jgi:hypothetical protein